MQTARISKQPFQCRRRSTPSRPLNTRRPGHRRRISPPRGPEQQQAVDYLCDAVSENVLHAADPQTQFHLSADACAKGLGAFLFQFPRGTAPGTEAMPGNRNEILPVLFMSWKLSDSEKRYSMPEKEVLAVVKGLQEVRSMIDGSAYP